ncbi:hypothetical protein HD598_002137 [Neomicrococcus aestuarii]|uniref:Uncharacterized protein n=1 Tax=Neomicrococcus aestuarii TaxID=556325 RepID=A0A7W8TV29_9MICC|nr:hypothetical protein [Neomicrococcus aestuarii]MBB5513450.1 hypothetical protein [Neomicrococcus aestuarii]
MSLKAALAKQAEPIRTLCALEKIYATLDDDDKQALREAVENLAIGPTVIAEALKSVGHHASISMVKTMREKLKAGHAWEH